MGSVDAAKMLKLNESCLICGNSFEHLGSHIYHKHNLRAKDYKEKFQLPHKLPLISERVKIKKQIAFSLDRSKYLSNLTKEFSFKKGHSRKGLYFSDFEKKQLIKNINTEKLRGLCPFCKQEFDHLNSHLYNKHGYILINMKGGEKRGV